MIGSKKQRKMTPEEHDKLPRNVQVILGGFDEDKDAYKECAKIKRELNSIGFTCSYGLDGVIYNVRLNILTT